MTQLGAISFINTLPVYLPLEKLPGVEITYGPPTQLNQAIGLGELDVSPVSSAYYLRHQQELILLKDLSVSSFGSVESVLFLSKMPLGADFLKALSQRPVIAVPDASETSIALLAYLLWKETGQRLETYFQVYPAMAYQQALETHGNALIIGDEALKIHAQGISSQGWHCYDLATLWHQQTGLPFVFAVWVARRSWAESYPERFQKIQQALANSRQRFFKDSSLLKEGVRLAKSQCTISEQDLHRYFTQCLSYELATPHREALDHFQTILQWLDHRLDDPAPNAPKIPSKEAWRTNEPISLVGTGS